MGGARGPEEPNIERRHPLCVKCSVLLKQQCTVPRVSSIQFILVNILVIVIQSLLSAVALGDEGYQVTKNEEFIIEGLGRKFTSNFG